MKMTDFVKTNNIKAKLKRLKDCSSKEERRSMEEQIFVPEEIQPYTGDTPLKSDLLERTITLIFKSKKDVELFAKHIKVSEYKGFNVRSHNLVLLVDFLKALEAKEIVYDRENRTFRNDERSNKVGKREQRIKVKRARR